MAGATEPASPTATAMPKEEDSDRKERKDNLKESKSCESDRVRYI